MSAAVARQLDDLARAVPAVAPLARLQSEVVRAAAEPAWAEGVPVFDGGRLGEGVPLLHAATVAIAGEVGLDRLWHAVPSFPTVSEVWLRLLEAYGL